MIYFYIKKTKFVFLDLSGKQAPVRPGHFQAQLRLRVPPAAVAREGEGRLLQPPLGRGGGREGEAGRGQGRRLQGARDGAGGERRRVAVPGSTVFGFRDGW